MAINDAPHSRPPRLLVVTDQEWVSLSMETLFSPRGYAVSRAATANQALQQVQALAPDVMIITKQLRDTTGTELCRELRDRYISANTPVMMLTANPWWREERLEALRAGAWDTCSLPVDAEELALRVDAWVRAKLSSDAIHEKGLLDTVTGLYNAQGLLRRIAELGAGARRHHRPLACVVMSHGTSIDDEEPRLPSDTRTGTAASTSILGALLRSTARVSDTVGRLSATEFVIIAPDTDSAGARGLAQRLLQAVGAQSSLSGSASRLHFGCYAVPDFSSASMAPTEMLIRAAEAVQVAEREGEQIRVATPASGRMSH